MRKEIEAMIISSLIQRPDEYQEFIYMLESDDFYDNRYMKIIDALKNGTYDPASLGREAEIQPLEFAKLAILNQIPSSIYGYVDELKKFNIKDRLIEELKDMKTSNIDEKAERIIKLTDKLREQKKDEVENISTLLDLAVKEIMDAIDNQGKLLLSPFQKLNSIVGGLMPGRLLTVAGRPGTGKSAFALQIAQHIATKGHMTLYVSLEMKSTELAMRIISSETEIPTIKMVNGSINSDDLNLIKKRMGSMRNESLIVTNKGRNIGELRALIGRYKPSLLVVDSINLMSSKGESERIRITNITRELKQIALASNIPIIMLAQLNREAEGSSLPRMSEIKESGSVEEDSDVVILLSEIKIEGDVDTINTEYKKKYGYYFIDPLNGYEEAQKKAEKIVMGLVTKNRNGGLENIPFICQPRKYKFFELPKDSYKFNQIQVNDLLK